MRLDTQTLAVANVIVRRLSARRERLAVAESLTGGLVAAALTSVDGASAVFDAGIVAYLPRTKTSLVGVPAALIDTHGVVSEEVARALASGVRDVADVDWGLGTTGAAGPSGHGGHPPGTVYLGLSGPGGILVAEGHRFSGDRERVRAQSTHAVLELLARHLPDVAN